VIARRGADLVVIGAGPAGLQAAVEAADAGCSVLLLDSAVRAGGQYHRQLPAEFHAEHPERVHHNQPAAAALLARLDRHLRAERRQGVTVWMAEPRDGGGALLHLLDAGGRAAGTVAAPNLVLATGAHDRALPFPGWDTPGVVTAGGAQALVKGARVLPGQRVAVAGTGPFLLPVAAGLAEAGARVVGVFEANRPIRWARRPLAALGAPEKVADGARYAALLARHRVRVHSRRAVIAANGPDRVESITTARLDEEWNVVAGSERAVSVDAVCVGFGFTPQLELGLALGCETAPGPDGQPAFTVDDAQRTGAPGVYAAGEVTGVGGAALAAAEGALAGLAVARALELLSDRGHWARAAAWHAARERERRFAAALADIYPVRDGWRSWLREDTLVCRCEEVPLARLRAAVDELGVTGLKTLKLTTRAGLGLCQGRICGPSVSRLCAALSPAEVADPLAFATRTIATPIRLGELAGPNEEAP
jgi:NADPH-dependent 2,4-dienoyl-CoA reductase/sulfur reductase-like enzyme